MRTLGSRAFEACRGERTEGLLVLRPLSGRPIDRLDAYRMVTKIAMAAGIPRHISTHSPRHTAPRTTEHYDRARGNLDRHAVHFLTAYVAGV